MSPLAALAALGLGAAAFLATLALALGRPRLEGVARILAALAAVALLPTASEPSARPFVAMTTLAALLPRPLALLLGSAGAAMMSLRAPYAALEPAPAPLVLVAAAAGAAAAAVSSSAAARLAAGVEAAWTAVAAGGTLALLLALADGGRVLRWGYGLGSGAERLDLPGPGLLLGLTLLASAGGTLVLGAHLVAAPSTSSLALSRVVGQRTLLLAAGLSILGAGFAVIQGVSLREDALAAGAAGVAGLIAATGLLVMGLALALGNPLGSGASALEARAAVETRIAAILAVLGALLAGLEGWVRQATYATPLLSGTLAAALLGLAAVQPTRLATLRRSTLLAALLSLLV